MRREDVRLRMLAKQGDAEARLQLGKAYLTGTTGIPRNVPTGVGYLKAAMPQARRQASVCIAMHLTLPELLEHGLLEPLEIAAQYEDVGRLKLAALQLARGELRQGREWLERCGSPLARELASGGLRRGRFQQPAAGLAGPARGHAGGYLRGGGA